MGLLGIVGSLGGSELLIILLIVLVLFGGAKLPKLARSLGQAQKEFKSGMDEDSAAGQAGGSTGSGTNANANTNTNSSQT